MPDFGVSPHFGSSHGHTAELEIEKVFNKGQLLLLLYYYYIIIIIITLIKETKKKESLGPGGYVWHFFHYSTQNL